MDGLLCVFKIILLPTITLDKRTFKNKHTLEGWLWGLDYQKSYHGGIQKNLVIKQIVALVDYNHLTNPY